MLPRDVRTRWNATYTMLDEAYTLRAAVNKITEMRDMKLRKYEIEAHEWEILRQLRDLLKVSSELAYRLTARQLNNRFRYSVMRHIFFHAAAHPASRRSSPPWTTSTNTWHRLVSMTSTTLQSGQPLPSVRKPSIGITIGRTTRSCIALR
jgi:hypothetical protein